MPISIGLYIFDGGLEGPEVIHVSSERELARFLELSIEICELNGYGLISLTPMHVDEVEHLFYFSVLDEHMLYENLDRILDYVAEDFGLPRATLSLETNHIIPLTA